MGHSHLNILMTQIKANKMPGLSFIIFVPVLFTFVGKGTIYSLRLRDSRDSQNSETPETPKTQ